MFRTVAPYIPPALTTAILGALFVQEFDHLAPEKFKLKIKPLLGTKSAPPAEFAGDAAPQRGVFSGGERPYSAVLVVQGAAQTEKRAMAKSAAKACSRWNSKDVDVSLGFGSRVWDAIKPHVPLGNVPALSTMSADLKLKDRVSDKSQRTIANTGGDLIVHVKADSQGRCVEVVKSVLKELESSPLNWSEDHYGYQPEVPALQCPRTTAISASSASLCKTACVPKVGGSYALYQKWEDDVDTMKGKAKPPMNHVERVRGMDQEGNKLQIVRHTARTGRLSTRSNDDKAGMLFVAYSADPKIFDYMLDRMVGKRGGTEDATLLQAKCTRAQLFYVPSQAQVNALSSH